MALGVPEVWRFDGETLRYGLVDGAYCEREVSAAVLLLGRGNVVRFLARSGEMGETSWVREWLEG